MDFCNKVEEFSLGDLVQLKSGGPTMTVNRVDLHLDDVETPKDMKFVRCSWFPILGWHETGFPIFANDFQVGLFSVHTLKKVDR